MSHEDSSWSNDYKNTEKMSQTCRLSWESPMWERTYGTSDALSVKKEAVITRGDTCSVSVGFLMPSPYWSHLLDCQLLQCHSSALLFKRIQVLFFKYSCIKSWLCNECLNELSENNFSEVKGLTPHLQTGNAIPNQHSDRHRQSKQEQLWYFVWFQKAHGHMDGSTYAEILF